MGRQVVRKLGQDRNAIIMLCKIMEKLFFLAGDGFALSMAVSFSLLFDLVNCTKFYSQLISFLYIAIIRCHGTLTVIPFINGLFFNLIQFLLLTFWLRALIARCESCSLSYVFILDVLF